MNAAKTLFGNKKEKMVSEKVAKVNDLKDGEKKEVKVGPKKILLSRIAGEYYATGLFCTHYKANLANATLSPDGRLVCQFHGACFNVKTGDVEEAPSLDALASYEVKVEGDDVIVIADDKLLEEGRRVPNYTKCDTAADSRQFVIIGGGAAAFTCASTLREQGFKGKIRILSREATLPLDRVKLSKEKKIEVDKLLLRNQSHYDNAGIEISLNSEVESVNPQENSIKLKNGDSVKYDSLLLATGGDPRFFWGDAKRFNNVFLVRDASDAIALEKTVEAKPDSEIVIVGSSFIGMEAAASFVSRSKGVTVIGMEKVPFERVLGEKVGAVMQALHEEKKIKFRMNAVVDTFDEENGKCVSITLKSGEKLPCDVVIVGAGVMPATSFLKSTFQLERDGSVIVDKNLKVVGHNNIYAAGDIARYPYHLNCGHGEESGSLVRIEHWNVAQQHGRVAAKNMLGQNIPYEVVPFFWTTQYGKSLRYVGHALNYDEVHIEGNPAEYAFIAYFIKDGKVIALCSLGKDPACSNASELFRLKKMLTAEEVKNGKSVLDIVLPSVAPTPSSAPKRIIPPASPGKVTKKEGGSSHGTSAPSSSSGLAKLIPVAVLFLAVAGYYYFSKEI